MNPLDVIEIPGYPGTYARRAFVTAWQAAGSPPLNSAGRLYAKQKYFYDGWVNRLPGFNPADNPDDERQALAHVRFVAGDIDPTPDRVRRLAAAGLIRPYKHEPWHWELPNVRSYAIVRSIPTTIPKKSQEDTMKPLLFQIDPRVDGRWVFANLDSRTYWKVEDGVQLDFLKASGAVIEISGPQPPAVLANFKEIKP